MIILCYSTNDLALTVSHWSALANFDFSVQKLSIKNYATLTYTNSFFFPRSSFIWMRQKNQYIILFFIDLNNSNSTYFLIQICI